MYIGDLNFLLPEIFLFSATIYLLLVVVFFPRSVLYKTERGLEKRLVLNQLAAKSFLLTVFITFILYLFQPLNFFAFNNQLFSFPYIFYFKLFLILGLGVVLINCLYYTLFKTYEYIFLFVFAILGFLVMISSSDLLLIYLGLELQSFAIYILVSYNRMSVFSTEAGLKYFILGAISSAAYLLGSSIFYYETGTLNLWDIVLLDSTLSLQAIFGLTLVVITFLFKLSAAPFHFWTPDVYEGAPLIVLMFISSLPKIVVLSVLCFFSLIIFPDLNAFWILVFYITSFFSLFIGTLGGLVQYNLKRLLAYSTIINIGFVLMNLLSPNINGLTSAFFYILTYVILLFNIFTIIVSTKRKHKTVVTTIYDLQQLFNSNPFMAFIFSISFFSLAGIPPLAGFISKFFVLTNLASYHYYFLVVLGVMFSVIATVYYIRLVKIIYFAKQDSFDFFTVQSRPLAYIISFTFIFNVFLIFFSADFLNFFKYLFFISF